MLALALYRQGLVENDPVFRYLSFFKILEIVDRGKSAIQKLAVKHLPAARQKAATFMDAADRPTMSNEDLARYLYEDARCAIAHAHSQPLIDPDDPRNTQAVWAHVPLAQHLAAEVIERELSVPRWWPPDWRPDWSLLAAEAEGEAPTMNPPNGG